MGLNVDLTMMLGVPSELTCPACKAIVPSNFEDYDIEGSGNTGPGEWRLFASCRECEHDWRHEVRLSTTSVREQVLAFHEAGNVPTADAPTVPPDDRVRLRLKLVTEEALEFVEACMSPAVGLQLETIRSMLDDTIRNYPVRVDMKAYADALGDIDYVVEGSRLEAGIDGEPIAAEIQRSNMAKFGPGGSVREDGKILKPPDWTPPDILGELKKQGWAG